VPDRDRPKGIQNDEAERLAELIERVDSPEADRRGKAAALGSLVAALVRSARAAGLRAVAAGHWATDVVTEVTPRLAVRDRDTLRAKYPGRSDSWIAERLVEKAIRASAMVGGAAGGLAAVEFAAPPALLAVPVQIVAETVCVVAVELKLVAELHEIAGVPARGTARERSAVYLNAWMKRMAVDSAFAGQGTAILFGFAARRQLRSILIHRMGRSTSSLAPFFAGAIAGAEVNRRSTRTVGQRVLADLRPALLAYDPRIVLEEPNRRR
jgi:hypothetical protein